MKPKLFEGEPKKQTTRGRTVPFPPRLGSPKQEGGFQFPVVTMPGFLETGPVMEVVGDEGAAESQLDGHEGFSVAQG